MKLVEILARDLKVWPKNHRGNDGITQDEGGCLNSLDTGCEPSFCEGDQCWKACSHSYLEESLEEAEDFATAVVTKEQWQAERDRQKGGEWKRHRGNGKQPKELGDFPFEVKHRDGNIWPVKGIGESCWRWTHDGSNDDIMAFRIIGQPQAEEVEMVSVKTIEAMDATDRGEGRTFNSAQDLYAALDITSKAKTDQIDGPIKWRDTIIHCQAIIEDCEREIQRNVDFLDAEGLMMQTDSKKAMQHYATSSLPFAEWLAGDCVVSKVDYNKQFTKGKKYKLTSTHVSLGENRVSVEEDDKGAANGWLANQFEFHSRP